MARSFSHWKAIHDSGSKFYEILLLGHEKGVMEIRRYGKTSLLDGGGACIFILHNDKFSATNSMQKQMRVKERGGYNKKSELKEGPVKKSLIEFASEAITMETLFRRLRTYLTANYSDIGIGQWVAQHGASAEGDKEASKPWEASPPPVVAKPEPVRSADWGSW